MLHRKINKFKTYDNKIAGLKARELECHKELTAVKGELTNVINEKIDFGIKYFNDKKKRKELLINAEKFGYSQKKINELKTYIDEWNQDCVTNDVVDSFKIIEEYVGSCQKTYKDGVLYRVSRFFNSEGRNLNEDQYNST